MPDIDKPDERRPVEPGQVDPLLREGRVTRWATWALAVAIAVIVGFVFFTLTTSGPNTPAPGGAQNAATSGPPRPAATNGSGPGQTGR